MQISNEKTIFTNCQKSRPLTRGQAWIGAVVISDIDPPDYYYFDGKRIGKKKYEKMKTDLSDLKEVIIYEEAYTEIITGTNFVDSVYLLYSK